MENWETLSSGSYWEVCVRLDDQAPILSSREEQTEDLYHFEVESVCVCHNTVSDTDNWEYLPSGSQWEVCQIGCFGTNVKVVREGTEKLYDEEVI